MLERGILCIVIGAAVLIAPYFLQSSRWHDMIAGAYIVGWFGVVLGIAIVAVELVQRARARAR